MMKRLKSFSFLHNYLFLFFSAVSTALVFLMDFNVVEPPESGITISLYFQIYKLLEILQQDLTGKGFPLTSYTILFFYVYLKVWHNSKRTPIKTSRLLSIVFSIGYIAGISFAHANTLSIIFTSSIRLIKSFFFLLGTYMLYLTVINLFYDLCTGKYTFQLKANKFSTFYDHKTWLKSWLTILGCWSIHIICRYPGAMSYDNYNQLTYFFGYRPFSDSQPLVHTWIFGAFVQIGLWLGSTNIGLFLFIIFQTLIMSSVLALTLSYMKKWNTPEWLFFITLGIYCIAPYYAGYAAFPIKDYLYTAFFVLLVLLLMNWMLDSSSLYSNTKNLFLWIISGTFLIFCRNNGKYLYVPLIFIMLLITLIKFKKKEITSKLLITAALSFILPLLLTTGINNIIYEKYNVSRSGAREMLSLPFQQTARYVRDYGDEVTEEEREIISKVLDYDNLPTKYMELTSDPVKSTMHAGGLADLVDYFKVWLQQFLKHPMCYIEATWNQNYYVFAPNIDNIVYNKDCLIGHEIVIFCGFLDFVSFKVPDFLHGLCSIMVSWYSLLTKLPIIGLLNNVAFYIMLMFTITCFILKDKCKKGYLILLPLILSFGFILLGPQIQNQPRYAFPIIYSMPIVTAYYIYIRKSHDE